MYHAANYVVANAQHVFPWVSVTDDQFTTEPMSAMKLAEQQMSEEELHYYFEQAINVRLQHGSHSLTLDPHTTSHERWVKSAEGALLSAPQKQKGSTRTRLSLLSETLQQSIIRASLTLLLMMTGFDLMGLLILFRHTH